MLLLTIDDLIKKLFNLTLISISRNEVPIASIVCQEVVVDGVTKFKFISSAYNSNRKNFDPTAHSEIIAIRKTALKLKKSRLNDCVLFTNLEPCLMCSGAIIHARLSKVYFILKTEKGVGLNYLIKNGDSNIKSGIAKNGDGDSNIKSGTAKNGDGDSNIESSTAKNGDGDSNIKSGIAKNGPPLFNHYPTIIKLNEYENLFKESLINFFKEKR